MNITSNTYFNESLGFSITKPEDWFYLPTQWALTIRNRAEPSNDELQDVLKNAQTPFVYMHFDHGGNDHVFPTVQATCRPIQPIKNAEREALLGQQVLQLKKLFQDIEFIETSDSGLICQCPANVIKATFTVRNNEGKKFQCLNRTYTIFAGYLGFTLGLSGPTKGPYAFHDDFENILKSVTID